MAREAPLWWHADLCQDHKHTRSDEDQKTTTLGEILAEESHKTPSKILARDGCAPRQDPCRATRQGPHRGRQWGHRQAHANQASTAVRMQLPAQPAGRAPACQHAASKPTQHTPAWRHADLREDPTTATSAACLPTWRRMRRWPGRVSKQGGATTDGMGRASPPSPIKQGET